MQCEAKSKQTGERCRRHATQGRRVCHYHGGKTPRGMGSPQTTTGRYSKDLPTALAAKYTEAQQDPTLLELRDDIALVDARICDVLLRVDSGESGALWKQLQAEMDAFTKAEQRKAINTMKQHLHAMRQLITAGASDAVAWREIYELIEQRRRLVESERRRLVELRQTITYEAAMVLITQISAIVRSHVHDRQARAAISADLTRLVGTNADDGVLEVG